MKLSQLEQINIEDLEQSVQDLQLRYAALFDSDVIQEDQMDWHHIISLLKHQLMKSDRTDHDTIDRIMTSICDQHGCDPHELHDQFLDAEDITPDEWIHTLRS